MTIYDLLDLIPGALVISGRPASCAGISYDSRKVRAGDAFFCISGHQFDGHDFAHDAVSRGAVAIVATKSHLADARVPTLLVSDSRIALAGASANIFGCPSHELPIIGITGTNGKTTTTYLVDSILRNTGLITGLIGTVETRIGKEALPNERTTPESLELQGLFARMLESGVQAVSMEVSSHAIDLHRVDFVRFAVAAFTNLTQDHLDYHRTMDEYFSVKKRLFTQADAENRVVNIDDRAGLLLASGLEDVITVGLSPDAEIRADEIELFPGQSRFRLFTPIGPAEVSLPLAGAYNVSNALVAAGCAYALGYTAQQIALGLAQAVQVPGRLERIDEGQPFSVFVDYAHTPDSLEQVLHVLKAVTPGRLIVVFGCGGDRDPAKRPLMGAAASKGADHVVITSDNPRSEDPEAIIAQIETGVVEGYSTYQVEIDRAKAIGTALALARAGDAVLIAGKGHEDYQIFADKTIRFVDREVATEALRSLC